jgi:predicted TIM-barrel fold metal-dependent hydrolase
MSPVIDVHVHLTPPEIAADRDRWLAGEGPWAALYQNPQARMMSTAELLAVMDEEGVDTALVCGFPWSGQDKAKRHNEWLLAEAGRHPGRLKPLAAFDVLAPWAAGHAEAMLAAGHQGLGELALDDRGFGPRELDILAALGGMCHERGRPLLMHVNEPIGPAYPGKAPLELSQIYALVRRLAGVKLILAHFGGGLPFLAAQKKEVRESLADVRFDTAAMPFLYDPAALPMALKVLGPEYFFLGTDCPLLKPSRYRRYFEAAGLSPRETELIMGAAAADWL